MMYILIRNNQNYIPLPWRGELSCFNYKKEDTVFSTEEFYEFQEGVKGDYSNIKGIVVISPLKNYEFISQCTKINQLFIFDSKAEITINLSELVYLKQLVINCKKFEEKDSVIHLLDNKMKCFEQDDNEDNPKISKYMLTDMFIKNVDINENDIDKIRKCAVFRDELIINSTYILSEFELSRRNQYLERKKYVEQNKNKEKRYTRQERKELIKRMFGE